MLRNNGATFGGDSNLSITHDLVDTCNEITCHVFVNRIVDFSRNSVLLFVGRDRAVLTRVSYLPRRGTLLPSQGKNSSQRAGNSY